ncbi:MAG: hypothetical protein LBC37_05600 [Zoogloeaceae bacterium]|jgi:hypothetical protein|nr:hypothetical protein [Zoogloeaceae bacterium]
MNGKMLLYLFLIINIVVVLVMGLMRARAHKKKGEQSIPEEQYNVLITDVNALRPSDPPLGVPAEANTNIMRVTEDYLFVRMASGSLYGGRFSMSWWAVFLTVIILLISSVLLVEEWSMRGLREFLSFNLLWPAASFWMFIGWRRQLPIIFNRKARTVTCWLWGKPYTQNWDEMTAYSKGGIVVGPGGSGSEGHLRLVMGHHFNPKKKKMEEISVSVYETRTNKGNYSASERAEMIWEYIRLYMEKGPAALPPFNDFGYIEYGLDHAREAFTLWGGIIKITLGLFFSPKQIVKNIWSLFRDHGFFGGIFSLFFFTILSLMAIPHSLLSIPTELFYMALDRILPHRKWPKELLEACNYVWDGSNDRGPLSEPARKAFDFNAARAAAQPSPETAD